MCYKNMVLDANPRGKRFLMSLSIDTYSSNGKVRETHKDTTIVPQQQTEEPKEIQQAATTTNDVPHNPRITHGETNKLPTRRSSLGPNDGVQLLEHRTHIYRSRRNVRIQCLTMTSLCALNLSY